MKDTPHVGDDSEIAQGNGGTNPVKNEIRHFASYPGLLPQRAHGKKAAGR